MKKIIILIFITYLLSACWAPRCPITTCDVNMEHRHAVPQGTYSRRPIMSKWRFHNFLSKKEREKRKSGDAPSDKSLPSTKKKRGAKKLFDWERE